LAVQGGLTSGVTVVFPPFAGGFEFAVAGGKDLLLAAFELVPGRDVAEGRVQAHGIVVLDEFADDAAGVFQGGGDARGAALPCALGEFAPVLWWGGGGGRVRGGDRLWPSAERPPKSVARGVGRVLLV